MTWRRCWRSAGSFRLTDATESEPPWLSARSPKTLTLVPGRNRALPERIPFFLRQNCLRMQRDAPAKTAFQLAFLPRMTFCVAHSLRMRGAAMASIRANCCEASHALGPALAGRLHRISHRRVATRSKRTGRSRRRFAIREHIYDRIISGYLTFLACAAVRLRRSLAFTTACHLDDGVLDSDGSPCRPRVAGMTPETFGSGSPLRQITWMPCSLCSSAAAARSG